MKGISDSAGVILLNILKPRNPEIGCNIISSTSICRCFRGKPDVLVSGGKPCDILETVKNQRFVQIDHWFVVANRTTWVEGKNLWCCRANRTSGLTRNYMYMLIQSIAIMQQYLFFTSITFTQYQYHNALHHLSKGIYADELGDSVMVKTVM